VGMNLTWLWGRELRDALANAVLAVVVFAVLDKIKQQ
jgi:hypothetical protein